MKKQTDKILEALRQGGLVLANRQSGKTTALLALAKELGSENCVIVSSDQAHSQYLQDLWRRLYKKESMAPIFCSAVSAERYLPPVKYVLVDQYHRCALRKNFFAAVDSPPENFRNTFIGDTGAFVVIEKMIE